MLVFLAAAAVACGDAHRTPSKPVKSATPEQLHAVAEKPAKSRTAQCLDSLGYENIAERDTSIAIDLMYAHADNFVGRVLYADLREAYLHPVAMECLLKAQRLLREKHPEYRLIVYDAARPIGAATDVGRGQRLVEEPLCVESRTWRRFAQLWACRRHQHRRLARTAVADGHGGRPSRQRGRHHPRGGSRGARKNHSTGARQQATAAQRDDAGWIPPVAVGMVAFQLLQPPGGKKAF